MNSSRDKLLLYHRTTLLVFLTKREKEKEGRGGVCMCEREKKRGRGRMWKRKSTCDESEETDSDVILQPSVSAWLLLIHIRAFIANKFLLRILLRFALFFSPLSITSSRDDGNVLIFLVYVVEAWQSFHNTMKTAPKRWETYTNIQRIYILS